jgi:hypothetical protein
MNPAEYKLLSFKVNIPAMGQLCPRVLFLGVEYTRVGWLSPLLRLFYLPRIAILKLTVLAALHTSTRSRLRS